MITIRGSVGKDPLVTQVDLDYAANLENMQHLDREMLERAYRELAASYHALARIAQR